jgi:hypothetical protein
MKEKKRGETSYSLHSHTRTGMHACTSEEIKHHPNNIDK